MGTAVYSVSYANKVITQLDFLFFIHSYEYRKPCSVGLNGVAFLNPHSMTSHFLESPYGAIPPRLPFVLALTGTLYGKFGDESFILVLSRGTPNKQVAMLERLTFTVSSSRYSSRKIPRCNSINRNHNKRDLCVATSFE